MEENAHKTLSTRAFFRQFRSEEVPDAYYRHLRGELSQKELFDYDEVCRAAAASARREVHRIELGDKDKSKPDPAKRERIRKLIGDEVEGYDSWVLIGGPPCQAYSLAGRSRMLGVVRGSKEKKDAFERRKKVVEKNFHSDHRHLLYREYLSIIADHWPPIFVMENVKGIISAKTAEGDRIFPKIRSDLEDPSGALGRADEGQRYRIFSLRVQADPEELDDRDFLLRAEDHGVPQRRHRVILLGIRSDIQPEKVPVLKSSTAPCLAELFNGLPSLNSAVSYRVPMEFSRVLSEIRESMWLEELKESRGPWNKSQMKRVRNRILRSLTHLEKSHLGSGGEFLQKTRMKDVPGSLGEWLKDPWIGGICNHATRTHMASDFHRYLFCAAFADELKKSPKLEDFPDALLPNHENVKGDNKDLKKHADRFRAQLGGGHSATVTCHIAKDGHAFIHHDPDQMRSLTVREAARIQTFPDNYFFEGGRTAQFKQVGNAVPPFLAHKIAGVVARVLGVG